MAWPTSMMTPVLIFWFASGQDDPGLRFVSLASSRRTDDVRVERGKHHLFTQKKTGSQRLVPEISTDEDVGIGDSGRSAPNRNVAGHHAPACLGVRRSS